MGLQAACSGVQIVVPVASVVASVDVTGEDQQDTYVNVLDDQQLIRFDKALARPDWTTWRSQWSFCIDWTAAAKEVVKHRRVASLIESAGKLSADTQAARSVHRRALALSSELHTQLSPTILKATSFVAETMMRRLYAGIFFSRAQLQGLLELSAKARAEKRSIIFLPSHKSHIDYIVLQYTFSRLGMGALAIAAGENLNIPVMGRVLRQCGAFFIRRTFSGPDGELYSAVVAAYLEGLLSRGANIMFFPEGGRSRTGKVLQPKVGMLGMLMEPILTGGIDDAYIVPVSVYYDKVMETRTYTAELMGARKKKESLGDVIGQAQHLLATPKMRYGSIHVRFAPAFSVRGYIDRHTAMQRASYRPSFNPCKTSADLQVLLKAMAYHTLEEINRVSSVTPTALVGTAMLCTMSRGVGRADLINRVAWLREKIIRTGGHVSGFFDFPGELTGEVVDTALHVLGSLVIEKQGFLEPVYAIAPGKHFELSYYRNMCVHIFIHQAIIAVVLQHFVERTPDLREVKIEAVMKDVRFLSKLLKYEFVFSGAASEPRGGRRASMSEPAREQRSPDLLAASVSAPEEWGDEFKNTALMKNFENALMQMVQDGIVEMDSQDPSVIRMHRMSQAKREGKDALWNRHFTFLCQLVWPVIESYWLVLVGLRFVFEHGTGILDEGVLLSRLQNFAKTLVELGHVHYDEAASQETLRLALQIFGEMHIVRRNAVSDDEGHSRMTIQLGEDYRDRGEGLSRLSALLQDVGSFRCRWHEQEGGEDYPDYIARLAFKSKL